MPTASLRYPTDLTDLMQSGKGKALDLSTLTDLSSLLIPCPPRIAFTLSPSPRYRTAWMLCKLCDGSHLASY